MLTKKHCCELACHVSIQKRKLRLEIEHKSPPTRRDETDLVPILEFSKPDALLQDPVLVVIKESEEDETEVPVGEQRLQLGLVDLVEVGDGQDALSDLDQVLFPPRLNPDLK